MLTEPLARYRFKNWFTKRLALLGLDSSLYHIPEILRDNSDLDEIEARDHFIREHPELELIPQLKPTSQPLSPNWEHEYSHFAKTLIPRGICGKCGSLTANNNGMELNCVFCGA